LKKAALPEQHRAPTQTWTRQHQGRHAVRILPSASQKQQAKILGVSPATVSRVAVVQRKLQRVQG
jgi:hypothetical protein